MTYIHPMGIPIASAVGGTRKLLLAAGLLALAACDSPRTVHDYPRTGIPDAFVHTVGMGEVPVVVFGNPSSLAPEVFEQRVVNALTGHHWGPAAAFRAYRQLPDGTKAWWAAAFDAPLGYSGNNLCAPDAKPPGPGPNDGQTRLTLAFCFYGDLQSEVRARLPMAIGGDAAKLDDLIHAASGLLIPATDPDRSDGTCDVAPCS